MAAEAAIGAAFVVMGKSLPVNFGMVAAFLLMTEVLAPSCFARCRIQKTKPKFAVIRHELLHALGTLVGGSVVGLVLNALIDSGSILLDRSGPCNNNNNNGTDAADDACPPSAYFGLAARVAVEIFAYFAIFDTYFYFGHRLLHTPALYWVHKPHHISTAPNALAAIAFNPLEACAFGLFFPLSLLVWTHLGGGFHFASFVTIGLGQLLQSGLIHSGCVILIFPPPPITEECSTHTYGPTHTHECIHRIAALTYIIVGLVDMKTPRRHKQNLSRSSQ